MGLYTKIKDNLPKNFSFFQFISILGIEANEAHNARNVLKQFYAKGYIKRISKNMYEKLK